MRTLTLSLVALLMASTVHAQDTPHRLANIAPYVAMISGNVADLVTTKNAFDRGAVEGNPLTGFSGQQRIAPLLAEKVVATALEAYMMHALERSGHPRIAKVMGYAAGTVTFSAAIYAHRWNQ